MSPEAAKRQTAVNVLILTANLNLALDLFQKMRERLSFFLVGETTTQL